MIITWQNKKYVLEELEKRGCFEGQYQLGEISISVYSDNTCQLMIIFPHGKPIFFQHNSVQEALDWLDIHLKKNEEWIEKIRGNCKDCK